MWNYSAEYTKFKRSQENSTSVEVLSLIWKQFCIYIQFLGECLLPIAIYRYKYLSQRYTVNSGHDSSNPYTKR